MPCHSFFYFLNRKLIVFIAALYPVMAMTASQEGELGVYAIRASSSMIVYLGEDRPPGVLHKFNIYASELSNALNRSRDIDSHLKDSLQQLLSTLYLGERFAAGDEQIPWDYHSNICIGLQNFLAISKRSSLGKTEELAQAIEYLAMQYVGRSYFSACELVPGGSSAYISTSEDKLIVFIDDWIDGLDKTLGREKLKKIKMHWSVVKSAIADVGEGAGYRSKSGRSLVPLVVIHHSRALSQILIELNL